MSQEHGVSYYFGTAKDMAFAVFDEQNQTWTSDEGLMSAGMSGGGV